MCVRCGTGTIAWCVDPYRHGDSDEPVSPGQAPVENPTKRRLSEMGRLHKIRRDLQEEALRIRGSLIETRNAIADIENRIDDLIAGGSDPTL